MCSTHFDSSAFVCCIQCPLRSWIPMASLCRLLASLHCSSGFWRVRGFRTTISLNYFDLVRAPTSSEALVACDFDMIYTKTPHSVMLKSRTAHQNHILHIHNHILPFKITFQLISKSHTNMSKSHTIFIQYHSMPHYTWDAIPHHNELYHAIAHYDLWWCVSVCSWWSQNFLSCVSQWFVTCSECIAMLIIKMW